MPAKRLPREERTCSCGCGKKFIVLPSSPRQFAPNCSILKNPSSNLDPTVLNHLRTSKLGILNPNWKLKDVRICACGCGKTFECLPSSKRRFLTVGHSKRGDNNPMRNKEVALRANSKKGKQKSVQGIANIANAARNRMFGPDNPFNDINNATKWLKATHPTMTPSETEFMQLYGKKYNLLFTGNGDLWIGKKCPDFSIPGTNIVIEISAHSNGRNYNNYTVPRTRHYELYGYYCIVIWANNSKPYFNQVPVEELIETVFHQSQLIHQPIPNPDES